MRLANYDVFQPNSKELCMDPNKRPDNMVRITTTELAQVFIEEQIAAIREQIGSKKVCWHFPAVLAAPLLPPCLSRQLATS